MLFVLPLLIAEPEWPDPGSEEPGGPKVFERDAVESYDEGEELDVEASVHAGQKVYRWKWYGWRNIIGDAAAAITIIAGGIAMNEIIAGIGAGLFVLGSPVAHFTKGNWGRALISMGMRVAAPALLGLLSGFALNEIDGGGGLGGVVGGAIGAVIGAYVAAGLDIGFLARDKVEVAPKDDLGFRRAPGFTLAFLF